MSGSVECHICDEEMRGGIGEGVAKVCRRCSGTAKCYRCKSGSLKEGRNLFFCNDLACDQAVHWCCLKEGELEGARKGRCPECEILASWRGTFS